MDEREKTVRLWFDMWLQKADLGIEDIFADDVVYTESWGPEYRGAAKVKQWFAECITRQDVLAWEIGQFFHKGDRTVVQWQFRYQDRGEAPNAFDGLSLIHWTADGKIKFLQEFGCNRHRYDPYQNGPTPVFEPGETKWF